MTDPPTEPLTDDPAPRAEGLLRWRGGRWIPLVVAGVAGNWLGFLLVTREPVPAHWLAQVAVASLAVLSCGWVLLQQYLHWIRPTRQLVEAIGRARAGELPIDDLGRIAAGGVRPLADVTRSLLRELRRQRAAYAELEHEMTQRVANRTEALERKLGTLRQQASRDPLSGLHNRRLLDEQLPRLVEACAAGRTPLAVLMLDIDHFKQVNDTLGHAAGDQLLTDVGQLIRSSIREQDMAFRCGGDEFVVVLPGQSRDSAVALADRLVSLMDARARTLKVGCPPRLSVGIATPADVAEPTAEALLAAADLRLYRVKQSRRGPRPTAA